MTDKKKIRTEIERLINEPAPSHDSQCNWEDGYWCALYKIEEFIDSLQKEPVSEDLQEVSCNNCQGFDDKEKCDELVFTHNCPIVKPISEDLEEAAKNHAAERYRTTRDRELAEKCKWSFISGAEWYKKYNNRK